MILRDFAPSTMVPVLEGWQRLFRAQSFSFVCNTKHVCWANSARSATAASNRDGSASFPVAGVPTKEREAAAHNPIVCINTFLRIYGCSECGRVHHCSNADDCMTVFNEISGTYVCAFSGLEIDRETVLGSFDAEVEFAATSTEVDAKPGSSIADMIKSGSRRMARTAIDSMRASRQQKRQQKRRRADGEDVEAEKEENEANLPSPKKARLEVLGDDETSLDSTSTSSSTARSTSPAPGDDTEEISSHAAAAQVLDTMQLEPVLAASSANNSTGRGGDDTKDTMAVVLPGESSMAEGSGESLMSRDMLWEEGGDHKKSGPITRLADIGRAGRVDEAVLEDDLDDREGDTQRFGGLSTEGFARINRANMKLPHNIPTLQEYFDEVEGLERQHAHALSAWAVAASTTPSAAPIPAPLSMSALEKQRLSHAQRLVKATYVHDPFAYMEAELAAFDNTHKPPMEAETEGSAWVQSILQVGQEQQEQEAATTAESAALPKTPAHVPHKNTKVRTITRKRYRRVVFQCMKRIQRDVASIVEYLARMEEGGPEALTREAITAKIDMYTKLALKLFRFMLSIDPLNIPIRQRHIGVVMMYSMLPNYFYLFDYFAPRATGEQNKMLVWAPDPWLYRMKQKGRLAALVGDSKRTPSSGAAALGASGGANALSSNKGKSARSASATTTTTKGRGPGVVSKSNQSLLNAQRELRASQHAHLSESVTAMLAPMFQQTDVTAWHNSAQAFFRDAHVTAQALRNALY